ncbi:hypothetical protein D3C72_992340 [compost metagenome]
MQIVGRGGAGVVRVGHAVLHQPHGAVLQLLLGVGQAVDEGLDGLVFAVLGHEGVDVGEPAHDGAAAVRRQLAAHQVERLNAVGAFIDHGDARIAQILRGGEVLGVARAAVDLHGQRGDVEALVGQIGFQHGRDQAHVVLGLGRRGLVRGLLQVGLQGGPQDEGAAAFDEGLGLHQHPAHVGVDHDGVGGAVRVLGAGQGAALQTVVGELDGGLIGGVADGQALQAGAEAGLVHDHEHVVHAPAFFADQPALGVLIGHDAGGVAVDAHLVLEAGAGDAVALARRAVRVDQEFRHHEQAQALDARNRAFDAGQHGVDDVVGEVVLARRDPDLLAGDRVGAVAVGHGLGADHAQVGAALRLGQVHGAGPFAGRHPGQVDLLQLVRGRGFDAVIGARRQARIHGKRRRGRRRELAHGHGHDRGQALTAVFRAEGQAGPAGLDHLMIGFFPALGRRHDVAFDVAAFLIARTVDRGDDLLGELAAFLDDLVDQVARQVGVGEVVGVAFDLQHVVQDEGQVADRRLVGHGITLSL